MAQVTVTSVETILLDLPTIRPHRLSMTTLRTQTIVLVRIRCSDGTEGVGEGTPIGGLAYGPESPESIRTNIEHYFRPLLVGAAADQPVLLMDLLRKSIKGNRFAFCAIETALLDALARRLDTPLSTLFGGRRRNSLSVAWTLASGETGRDIDEAERMLSQRRHNIFKLKIGHLGADLDVAHVRAIKRALGDRASVRVDVNCAWSETVAVRAIAALEDAGCDLVEQPVAAQNVAALRRLADRFDVPIMADEAIGGPEDGFTLARDTAADVFAVKIAQNAGPTNAAMLAAIADAAGVALYGGTMLEAGIGTAASAQLFSTFRSIEFGTELFGPLLLTEEILQLPLEYADFELHLPDGPGIGVLLDEDRIRALRRDRPSRLVQAVA